MDVINNFPFLGWLSVFFFAWEGWKLLNYVAYQKMRLLLRHKLPGNTLWHNRSETERAKLGEIVVTMMLPFVVVESTYLIWVSGCLIGGLWYWPFTITGMGLLTLVTIKAILSKSKNIRSRYWIVINFVDGILSMLLISFPIWVGYLGQTGIDTLFK